MFRRQRPPTLPAKPPEPPQQEPAAVQGGGQTENGFGFRPSEPASAPNIADTALSSAPADTTIGSAIADRGSDTSTRTTMNTPFSTNPSTGISPSNPLKSDIPRRVVEIPGTPPKRVAPTGTEGTTPAASSAEMRKLIVGRDISLSGEIAACDVLVVEGTVEAKLRDGRTIEIADTGLFKGSVEIDDADIGGRFEGDITVRGTLKVRATGKIQGNVRYGTLEVENGGQLSGSIEVLTGGLAKPAVTFAPAPAPTPVADLSDSGIGE
ncbi:bactofilin family protein [Niveispirillum irakense]|uniref:bactofilin family protein n=1 Tax=Niveispirillum irakense TaxID=34011 RepID=UPI0004129DBE|nr:polymer-forming cytoskeletal protein [Niveispirillum irakense]